MKVDDSKIKVFKALANPTRLELVRKLSGCPKGEACGRLSDKFVFSQPTMSHHFLKLVEAGVVQERKFGTQKEYRLNKSLLDSVGIDISKL